ncbi:MAG: glycosyltransferase family A protein [Desulfuromonadales bacterium]
MAISVLIPSYNHCSYVVEAIESVLSQQGAIDVDLIVIDDGSTDGSPEAIRRLWEAQGGFRFIARENRGLIRTLNEGLGLARGDFFCELASDDYFPRDSLLLRRNFLHENPDCIAVFADGIRVRGHEKTGTRIIDNKRRRMFSLADPIPTMLGGVLPVFSTGLIRTEALRQAGGFDEENFRYYEDLDTPIRLALAGRIGFLDAPVIFRREHQTNVSGTTQHIRAEKVVWPAKLLRMHEMGPYKSILRKQLRRSLIKLARSLNRQQEKSPLSHEIKQLFSFGWGFAWQDFRILFYLLKFRIPYSRGRV